MPPQVAETELYPMRVVSRVTGLPPDTIRAWERRYGAIDPHRTDGNARRYSAADVRKLTLLRDLTQRGHAIGAIAPLGVDALETMVDRDPGAGATETAPRSRVVEDYLSAIARMDTGRATEALLRAAAMLDNRALVFDLVLPIVQEVGRRWSHGDLGIAQEHMVSAELRSLLAARSRLVQSDPGAPRMVVSTPAGHRHEFGVLAAAMLANGRGIDVLYLGPDLPDDELVWSVGVKRADLLVLGIAVEPKGDVGAALVRTLTRLAAHTDVWFGCPPSTDLGPLPESVRVFHNFEEFDIAVAGLRR